MNYGNKRLGHLTAKQTHRNNSKITLYFKLYKKKIQQENLHLPQKLIDKINLLGVSESRDYQTNELIINKSPIVKAFDLILDNINYLMHNNPRNEYKPINAAECGLISDDKKIIFEFLEEFKIVQSDGHGYYPGYASKKYRIHPEFLKKYKSKDKIGLVKVNLSEDSIYRNEGKAKKLNQKKLKRVNAFNFTDTLQHFNYLYKLLTKGINTCITKGFNFTFLIDKYLANALKYFENKSNFYVSECIKKIKASKYFMKYFNAIMLLDGGELPSITQLSKLDYSKIILVDNIYNQKLIKKNGRDFDDNELDELMCYTLDKII